MRFRPATVTDMVFPAKGTHHYVCSSPLEPQPNAVGLQCAHCKMKWSMGRIGTYSDKDIGLLFCVPLMPTTQEMPALRLVEREEGRRRFITAVVPGCELPGDVPVRLP